MQLNVQLDFVPRLAGGRRGAAHSELYPLRVDAWLTHEARSSAASCALAARKEVGALALAISTPQRADDVYAPLRHGGAYTFAGVGRAFARGQLSRSTRLAFAVYARTATDDGNEVLTRVGASSIGAEQLADALASGRSVAVEVVQNETCETLARRPGPRAAPGRRGGALVKGVLRVRVGGVTADAWRALLMPPQPRFDTETAAQAAERAALMDTVVTRSMRAFTDPRAFLPRPSLPFIERYHCPEDRLDASFAPSCAYVAELPRARTKADFFRGAARCVLRRRGLTADDAHRLARALDAYVAEPTPVVSLGVHEALGVLVRIVTLLGSALPYLDDWNADGDRVEADEDMYAARLTLADDCEGTARENYMCARDLAQLAAGDESDAIGHLLGAGSRMLQRLYVPCSALLAVSNRQLTYAAAHMSQSDALAHTACVLVPRARFLAWCERGVRRQLGRADKRTLGLPTLMCEGTTRMAPELLPLDYYYAGESRAAYAAARANMQARAAVASRVQAIVGATRLSTEIQSRHADDANGRLAAGTRDVSHFYKHVVALQTDAFVQVRTLDFTLVYRAARTYGVTFNDFLLPANQERVGLVPHLQLSEYEAAIVDVQLAANEPVPPLTAQTRAPPLPPALAALAGPGRSDTPPSDVPLQPRTLTISGRLADMGRDELDALRALRADPVLGAAQCSVRVTRVCDALTAASAALDVVDIALRF